MSDNIICKINVISSHTYEGKRFARIRFIKAIISRYILDILLYLAPTNSFRVLCYKHMGVNIGKDVFIGNQVLFDKIAPHKITIGDHTSVGERCIITAHADIPSNSPLRLIYPTSIKETIIGNGVWIMPSCIIAPGVKIDDYSVIATGSVVTKNVPSLCLVAGIPAKVVKKLELPNDYLNR